MWLFDLCCKKKKITEPEYLYAVSRGLLPTVQSFLKTEGKRDVNPDMILAVHNGQKEVVQYLIEEHGAFLFDQAVQIACEKANYSMVELLLKKGAKTNVALRYAKTSNISGLIHRFREKIEIIKP